ncbi:MAG TPA: hypothetical protein QKA08_02505 [Candidatus Megaira endosymbiont of Nemacystus decipiens]|nr:hypothetical protein [Candidatus Megaera endosymbiont of Nemacystus decipiens]
MTSFLDENLVIAICFTILVYLIYRPLKKAVLESLDKKILEIKNSLNETRKIKTEAKNALIALESEIKAFEKKKTTMLKESKDVIKQDMDLRHKELELLLKRLKESGFQNIQHNMSRATEDMKKEFVEKVVFLVQSYLKETNNNQLSDKEILEIFIKNSQ